MYVYIHWSCASVPVSGWILNAGTVESLCMKPYVTLPLEPSSASTAWTCRANVPAGWFSRTDVLSRYCRHWGGWGQQMTDGGREGHGRVSMKKVKSIAHYSIKVSWRTGRLLKWHMSNTFYCFLDKYDLNREKCINSFCTVSIYFQHLFDFFYGLLVVFVYFLTGKK